jgi:hypothetical protein
MNPWRDIRQAVCRSLFLLFLCACGTGCAKRGAVTGTVTYNDKPLSFGSVTVMGDDGLTQVTPIGKDGSYRFESVVVGPAKFVVVCIDPEITRKALGRDAAGGADGKDGKGGAGRTRARPSEEASETNRSLIPFRYSDFSKTDLQFTVESGTNKFDLKLKDPPPPNE